MCFLYLLQVCFLSLQIFCFIFQLTFWNSNPPHDRIVRRGSVFETEHFFTLNIGENREHRQWELKTVLAMFFYLLVCCILSQIGWHRRTIVICIIIYLFVCLLLAFPNKLGTINPSSVCFVFLLRQAFLLFPLLTYVI